jgi:hypothetical protein
MLPFKSLPLFDIAVLDFPSEVLIKDVSESEFKKMGCEFVTSISLSQAQIHWIAISNARRHRKIHHALLHTTRGIENQ